ncbi:sulfurtransferase/chromate resistance protein [Ruegeria sp. HKCCA5426]|uniref:chromate resistance protein ChrB domain-containing protein n=1 Tax=Ruegeria sp. HKCCA5426 TaxID=2682985 RepID=UPI0014893ADF|nr:sulfurtransferase/chromate resistance protein [Ruegeria sp. HKCCA5426]
MPAPNSMTPKQLLRLIGTPQAPVLVDICVHEDFQKDPFLIPGSFRRSALDFDSLKEAVGDRPALIICQKGKKLSQGVVSWLRSEGVDAEYLDGGMHAWRETQDAPRIPASTLSGLGGENTLWVTRHRPKIDRIACPWLIRRFVDPKARFLFVAPNEVQSVADVFEATPFDVENVFWSHRNDQCTFDTMLDEFALRTPALDRMATVIRAADTNRHDLSPEAAGLLAISVGLSRQYRDDHQNLVAGLQLYDALYRWARDGFEERHDWPTDKKS